LAELGRSSQTSGASIHVIDSDASCSRQAQVQVAFSDQTAAKLYYKHLGADTNAVLANEINLCDNSGRMPILQSFQKSA